MYITTEGGKKYMGAEGHNVFVGATARLEYRSKVCGEGKWENSLEKDGT